MATNGVPPGPATNHSYLIAILQYVEGNNTWNAINTSLDERLRELDDPRHRQLMDVVPERPPGVEFAQYGRPLVIGLGAPERTCTCIIRRTPEGAGIWQSIGYNFPINSAGSGAIATLAASQTGSSFNVRL